MSIGDQFSTLTSRIQVTPASLAALNTHATEIETRLSKAFKVTGVKNYGSHSRGTAIGKFSDIDLFFIVAVDDFKWGDNLIASTTALARFKDQLVGRYPQSTVGRDGHAIVVEFSDGSKIDVLPAIFKGINKYKKMTLWIPDGNGKWLETSPDAHSDHIKDTHASSGNKFSYLIQLVKFWRENRTQAVPLSSFYLEMLFASKSTFFGVKSYAECMRDAFAELNSRKCASLNDPLGISGRIDGATTAAKLEQANSAVAYALDQANRALAAESNRDSATARNYWNSVFNGGFPS